MPTSERVAPRPRAWRGAAAAAALALAAALAGCQGAPTGEPPDDEALAGVKARGEMLTPVEAAEKYFRPKKVVDYFPQMDAVGQPDDPSKDWPDQLLDLADRAPGGKPPAHEVGPLKLSESEAFGRNAWMIWCAGNEGFWDWLANNSFGGIDLLKLIDGRKRGTLFRDAGLINEPEMSAPHGPDAATEFGVWLSEPSDPKRREWRDAYLKRAFKLTPDGKMPPNLYGDEGGTSYGGGEGGGYGGSAYAPEKGKAAKAPEAPAGGSYAYDNEPPPEIYGLSSGVVGLRLFPNPNFDAKARKRWDAGRYYNDPDYYNDPNLVRPFRVGMSCAFCHASFHPLKPPRDATDPAWENISGNIGAQYLRFRAVFANMLGPESFIYHVLDSQPPGSLDTSFIPSDNINNPNAMNSVFGLPERMRLSGRNPKELLGEASATQPSVWTEAEVKAGKVPKAFVGPDGRPVLPTTNPRLVPRVLFDGADSIGAYAALSRVYLNIGSYWEQWIRIHKVLVGFRPQEPFRIADCEKHSVYWHATDLRVGPMRDYFLRATPPMRLTDAKPGVARPSSGLDPRAAARDPEAAFAAERARHVDKSKLKHGREVFARNCVVCHSSKQSPERVAAIQAQAAGGELFDHDPGRWLRDPGYLDWALKAVETREFWADNYLSSDYRIPVNLVRTNSGRAMATNGMLGHMWSDFASASYQKLPSVGSITYFNPYLGPDGGEDSYTPRHKAPAGAPEGGGGPGYYRVPTLISIWSTAPLLHNNSLGLFNNDPSVDGRLDAFDDAMRKLLWPERRLLSSSYNGATPERLRRDHGLIWRTPVETYLSLPGPQVPAVLGGELRALAWLRETFPWLADPRWLLVPAGLAVVAFAVLSRAPRGKVRWAAGYAPLAAGIVLALLVGFLSGRLGELKVGPIPKGTPVNLLANINPEASESDLKHAVNLTVTALTEAESRHMSPAEREKLLREKVAPELMKVSKCPDFVMDQGHYFEWFKTMTDDDKDAVIELLKTF